MTAAAVAAPTTFDVLAGIFVEVVGVRRECLSRETLIADLEADDLEKLDVLLRAEEAIGVSLTDAEVESTRTLGDLEDLFERKRAGQ